MPQSGQKLLRICKRASCLNAHSLPDISRLHCHLLRLLTRSSFSLPHIGHTNAVSKNIIASYCISHTVFMCTVDFNDWLKIKPRHERQRSWSIHSGKTLSQSKWCHLDVIWRHHKIQHQFFEQCEIRLPHVLNYCCSYDVQTAVLCNDVHMFIWFHMLFIVMFKHRTAIWAWSRQTDHPIHAVASPKSTSRAIHFFFRPSQFKFEEPLSPDAMFDLCTAFGSLSFGNVVESSWIELNRVESSWIELNRVEWWMWWMWWMNDEFSWAATELCAWPLEAGSSLGLRTPAILPLAVDPQGLAPMSEHDSTLLGKCGEWPEWLRILAHWLKISQESDTSSHHFMKQEMPRCLCFIWQDPNPHVECSDNVLISLGTLLTLRCHGVPKDDGVGCHSSFCWSEWIRTYQNNRKETSSSFWWGRNGMGTKSVWHTISLPRDSWPCQSHKPSQEHLEMKNTIWINMVIYGLIINLINTSMNFNEQLKCSSHWVAF